MDMLPTLASLGGGKVPDDRIIDGKNIVDLVHGKEGAKSPTKAYYYYMNTQLMAVRSGKWKLHVPRKDHSMKTWNVFSQDADIVDNSKPLLYDLESDIGETKNLADANPEIVKQLMDLAEEGRNDIGDYDRAGKGARFYDPEPIRPDIKKWKKQFPKKCTFGQYAEGTRSLLCILQEIKEIDQWKNFGDLK